METKKLIKAGISMAAIICAVSCAKSKDDGGAGNPPVAPEVPAPVQPEEILVGSWQSTCIKSDTFGITEATALKMTDRDATFILQTSRESDCSLIDIQTKYVTRYLSPAGNIERMSTGEVEFTPVSVLIKPISPVGVSTLNIRKWCGISDWVLGQERDVTKEVKEKARNCIQPIERRQAFSRQGDRLFLGKAADGPNSMSGKSKFFVKKAE